MLTHLPAPLPLQQSLATPVLTNGPASPATTSEIEETISISTAFHPGSIPIPDTILSSSDGVMFYVYAKTILDQCSTSFEPQLCARLSDARFRNQIVQLDALSAELNIILHAFSSSPVFNAVAASAHLLSYDLSLITDAMAERIGAVYLKKLLLLHVGRFSALKLILLQPPLPHPLIKECGFEDQKKLTRAWALASAYLAWDARPDLSTHSMRTALNPLMEHLTCELCIQSLKDRIKAVVVQWASVKKATASVDMEKQIKSCLNSWSIVLAYYLLLYIPLSAEGVVARGPA
ncbi:hypothetical protein CPB84DRAFT_1827245 [Gymnopilus junonius]|uniref:Uncharacterized protein n=1 Tax=Gymnopilus junonius TaxID=109634 RepID=A0A9P5NEG4_GYMJU|nr:hypothetical protein CPB84DRAFT_1827245 [Gymnopilus junonius]